MCPEAAIFHAFSLHFLATIYCLFWFNFYFGMGLKKYSNFSSFRVKLAWENAQLRKKSPRKQESCLHYLLAEKRWDSFADSQAEDSQHLLYRHQLWWSKSSIWNLHNLPRFSWAKGKVLWEWQGLTSRTSWLFQDLRSSVPAIISFFMQLHDLQDCKVKLAALEVNSSSPRLEEEETRTSKRTQGTSPTEAVPEMLDKSCKRKTSLLHTDIIGSEFG